LFPSEFLEEMIQDYFENPNTEELWFTAVNENVPVALAYCAPEKFTEGTYNLYAIGVHLDYQGKGVGRLMMAYLEQQLTEKGHRILIVETSGSKELSLTREFYEKIGYTKEATLREFWAEGEDKVIYWKQLS